MKKRKEEQLKQLAFFAIAVLAIVGFGMLMINFMAAATIIGATGLVIAGIELTPEQEKMYKALEENLIKIAEKNEKGYISETKAKEMQDSAIKAYVDDFISKHEIDIKTVKGLQDQLDKTGTELLALKDNMGNGVENPHKQFSKELKQAFETNKEAIEAAFKGGQKVTFTIKTAATVITSSNFGAGSFIGYREPGVDGTLPNEFEPISLVMTINGGKGSNPLTWMERAKLNGGAAGFAEGSDVSAMDVEWTEKGVNTVNLGVYAVLSKLAINNYPALESEVRSELFVNLRNLLNYNIIAGAGDGTTGQTELKGVLTYASAFNAGGVTVINPNMWDVLLLAWKQSRKAYKGSRPNAILVSIGGGVDMDLAKDELGRYLLPDFMIQKDKTLKGVRIIEADDITDGDYLVGDFSKVLLNTVEDITFEIGWFDAIFKKRQFAIMASWAGMQRVKEQYKASFVKGTFATDIATITATTT